MKGDELLWWVLRDVVWPVTMAHLEMWREYIGEFRWLGDAPQQVNEAR
jgi:hypothetical protein